MVVNSAWGRDMSRHKIEAEIEVKFHLSGAPDDEREVAYPTVLIEYAFSKGCREVLYLRNGDPGFPAEPPEVEAVNAKLIDGDGLAPTEDQVWQWAQDWIDSEAGYNLACANAVDDFAYCG